MLISPAPKFGWYFVTGLDKEISRWLMKVPGPYWDKDHWVVGADIAEMLEPRSTSIDPIFDSRLYDFQTLDAGLLYHERRRFLSYDMGLGKTPTAVEALELLDPSKTLIVCPAIVRSVWEDHLNEWWDNHPTVAVVNSKKDLDLIPHSPVVITSYEMLSKIPVFHWSAVIVDESHYVKNAAASRSKALKVHLETAKPMTRFFLTGTPLDNEPTDVFNQVDLLFPGIFGNEWQFKRRYCLQRPNEYAYSGKEWYGLNPETAPELSRRLKSIMSRVTKKEVAHLLPPLRINTVRVKPVGRGLKALLEAPLDELRTIGTFTSQKVQQIVSMVENAQANGVSHVAVMTHLRSTAERVAALVNGVVVHGEETPEERMEKVNALRKTGGVLCATMHSLTTGVSLPEFSYAIFGELYGNPSVVAQAMNRVHRISGKLAVQIDVLVLEGTAEERLAYSLLEKLGDISKVITQGVTEEALLDGLASEEIPLEELLLKVAEEAAF
jgi:SWI/SNF-related matrix-associated actin-dependent regulator 1 of chromatin subfamily A